MKKISASFSRALLPGLAATGLLTVAAPAQAASFSGCVGGDYDISSYVSGTADCSISNDFNQDFQNGSSPISDYTVNEAGFFGISTWEFSGKLGVSGFAGDGEGQSGTWDISNVIQDDWADVMLVFKSGKGTQLVGYQLEEGVTSGTWQSIYEKSVGAFDINGKNAKNVSHISVYYSLLEEPEVGSGIRKVPEPTVLSSLLLIGGFCWNRKRKINADA